MNEITTPPTGAFAASSKWSREQTLLAFQFYCETPFGQLHSRNKKIIELARLIGRTPGALAMKCVNFASLDPTIRESGRVGLSNVSMLDREVWDEFHANWDGLVDECEALRSYLLVEKGGGTASQVVRDSVVEPDFSGATRLALVEQRVKQDFFRNAILASYGNRCCITGVRDKQFLIASHIVAWKEDPAIRLHPGNGLCLSVIHDKAFDKHLFSLTDDYRVVLSDQLRSTKDKFLRDIFLRLEDSPISLPDKFLPVPAFIQRHRKHLTDASASDSAQ